MTSDGQPGDGPSVRARLARLADDVRALPAADDRAPDDVIGSDGAGLPG